MQNKTKPKQNKYMVRSDILTLGERHLSSGYLSFSLWPELTTVQVHVLLIVIGFCSNGFFMRAYGSISPTCYISLSRHASCIWCRLFMLSQLSWSTAAIWTLFGDGCPILHSGLLEVCGFTNSLSYILLLLLHKYKK